MKSLAAAAWLVFAASVAMAQPEPIDVNWVYVTQVKWIHAPKGIGGSEGFAHVLVLYPEGQFLEVQAYLVQNHESKAFRFSLNDGTVLRVGTWTRTDDRVIRIHSRDTFTYDQGIVLKECDSRGKNCTYMQRRIPGPWTDDTCGLEGPQRTHLAQTIHCKRLIAKPLMINFDLSDLEAFASDAFAAASAK